MQTYSIELNTPSFEPSSLSSSQKKTPHIFWQYADIVLHAGIVFVYSVAAFFHKTYAALARIFLAE
jgi:hypothetical protein